MSNYELKQLKKLGKCKLSVYAIEGENIPHFHLENINKTFRTAICLNEAKYFKHGKYRDELNKSQKIILHDFLTSKRKIDNGNTIWEKLATFWNNAQANSTHKVDINNMPDYTKLSGSVH